MAKHKVHFFKINLKDERLDEGELFSTQCAAVHAQPVDDKILKLTDEQYRLTYFAEKGDHFEGKIVKYRSGTMTTGSMTDDELNDLALDDGERFVEVTHFVYSPDTGILSFEYNQHGPRVGMFTRYLNAMQAKIDADIHLFVAEPLMHPDVLQEIASAREIKALKLEIPTSKIPTDFERHNLIKGLMAAGDVGNPGQLILTIKGSRGRGDKTPLMSANAFMTGIRQNTWELGLFGSVDVTIASDFGSDTFNLLENKFEASREWTKAITSADSPVWFAEMLDLYQRNRELLLQSSAMLNREG